MRTILVGLAFLIAVPAFAKTSCGDLCGSSYSLCMKRSTTKSARAMCKQQRKSCKKSCKG